MTRPDKSPDRWVVRIGPEATEVMTRTTSPSGQRLWQRANGTDLHDAELRALGFIPLHPEIRFTPAQRWRQRWHRLVMLALLLLGLFIPLAFLTALIWLLAGGGQP